MRVWCLCKCGAELLAVPGTSCPSCGKGALRAMDWVLHVSVEDEYIDGRHIVVICKSDSPLAGHYCTVHQCKEYQNGEMMPEQCRKCTKIQIIGSVACEKCPAGDNKK